MVYFHLFIQSFIHSANIYLVPTMYQALWEIRLSLPLWCLKYIREVDVETDNFNVVWLTLTHCHGNKGEAPSHI